MGHPQTCSSVHKGSAIVPHGPLHCAANLRQVDKQMACKYPPEDLPLLLLLLHKLPPRRERCRQGQALPPLHHHLPLGTQLRLTAAPVTPLTQGSSGLLVHPERTGLLQLGLLLALKLHKLCPRSPCGRLQGARPREKSKERTWHNRLGLKPEALAISETMHSE